MVGKKLDGLFLKQAKKKGLSFLIPPQLKYVSTSSGVRLNSSPPTMHIAYSNSHKHRNENWDKNGILLIASLLAFLIRI